MKKQYTEQEIRKIIAKIVKEDQERDDFNQWETELNRQAKKELLDAITEMGANQNNKT